VRAGDGQVSLDPKGRLVEFEAIPPQVEERPAAAPSAPDWARVFAATGLDPSRFAPTDPTWMPLAMADARAAWTGTRASAPDAPLRLEAAAWRGSIVFARVIGPWARPERQQAAARSAGQTANDVIAIGILLLVGIGAALLARHNLRLDRADRRGAARLGAFSAVLAAIGWALQADHVAGTAEVAIVILGAGVALFSGGAVWLLYVALEPFVRRRWPHTVITWNRLLAGRLSDPLVGRDMLIGSVLGVGLAVLFFGGLAFGRVVLPAAPEPVTPSLDPLLGARFVGAAFVSLLYNSIMGTLALFSIIFLMLLVCRKVWITSSMRKMMLNRASVPMIEL
jgi:serine/threonine-protein kinase